MRPVIGLARISLTTPDARRLALFYEQALGFRRLKTERRAAVLGDAATRITLGLGQQIIDLMEFDQPGRPYPMDSRPSDPIFQHLAIIIRDMAQAYRRLVANTGWRAISTHGPETLPDSSGGVTAFKFRDPDGHPLELLMFPTGRVPIPWSRGSGEGIDHSAISVRESGRSIAFYQALGLLMGKQTLNLGGEQERLDGIPIAHLKVTALVPFRATPHVELLCYGASGSGDIMGMQPHDVAATRLVFATAPASDDLGERGGFSLRDPDGHYLQFES